MQYYWKRQRKNALFHEFSGLESLLSSENLSQYEAFITTNRTDIYQTNKQVTVTTSVKQSHFEFQQLYLIDRHYNEQTGNSLLLEIHDCLFFKSFFNLVLNN